MTVYFSFFRSRITFCTTVFLLQTISNCHEYCEKDDASCLDVYDELKENKYVANDSFSHILTKISRLSESYVECPFKNCSCYMDVLKGDLEPFSKGITKKMFDNVRAKGVKYLIFENKLYREQECMFPSRCSGIEYFLKQLLPELKNTEIIINTRDWPQISKHFQIFGPVFSFSKTSDYFDIMYPAWSFWEGGPAIKTYPTGLGRWDKQRKSLAHESDLWPWSMKKSMGLVKFFRGSRTSEKRDVLVLLSRKYPKLVDAQYTKNQAWKSSHDTLGEEPADVVPLEYHCQYKYLFNFKGVAASFRFKHLFLCGSLVIHVGDEWLEFFYPSLQPWVHYVPLKENATEDDIKKLLSFLMNHDSAAQKIAERGQKFIQQHLTFREVKCYWKKLLTAYQKLVKYAVKFDESLIEVK